MNIKKLFDLSNRTVILTGGSGLLGSQYAEGLSQAGANLVLADINYAGCKNIAKQLEKNIEYFMRYEQKKIDPYPFITHHP